MKLTNFSSLVVQRLKGLPGMWKTRVQSLGREEHWSGLSFLPPGDLPDLGIEPGSLAMQAVSFIFFTAKDFLINGRNSKIHKDLNYFLVEFA